MNIIMSMSIMEIKGFLSDTLVPLLEIRKRLALKDSCISIALYFQRTMGSLPSQMTMWPSSSQLP